MNTYKNISQELLGYFSNHPLIKVVLPFDSIILGACLVLMLLQKFISIGGLLSAIAYYGFIFSLILCYSKLNEKMLYIGLGAYAALEVFDFLKYAIFSKYRFLDYYSLVSILVFGGLAYLVYKKTLDKVSV